jgi:mannosyl-3-phosphoglycerate phosphatase
MHTPFKQPDHPLVVYTDLDGTLLDHDSYTFTPALPALQRLALLNVPVIPVTSKTLAELLVLDRKLNLHGPCITENGGVIAVPEGYFGGDTSAETQAGYHLEYLSPHYKTIVDKLNELRNRFGFRFEGFADLSIEAVAEQTGLSTGEAQRARRRLCSEPLTWHDSDTALEQFAAELDALDYTLVRGGRFYHVLGKTDKARAISKLNELFARAGFTGYTSLALGDSPNDSQMLLAADVAVAVRRKDGGWLDIETDKAIIRTSATGPDGWNEAIQHYLDNTAAQNAAERTQHG